MFDKTTGETYIGETKIRDHDIRVILLQNQPPAWELQQMLAAVHAEVHGPNMTGIFRGMYARAHKCLGRGDAPCCGTECSLAAGIKSNVQIGRANISTDTHVNTSVYESACDILCVQARILLEYCSPLGPDE